MKPTKHILILVLSLIGLSTSSKLQAQMPDSTSTLVEWRQYYFAQLDSSSLLAGKPLLEMTNYDESIFNFQGNSSDSSGDKDNWYDMHSSIYQAIGTPPSLSTDSIQQFAGNLIFQDVIPILGMSFDYAHLHPQAWANGMIDTQNMQVILQNNQNPFSFKELVSFAPAVDFIRARNPQIIFPSQLFFTNKSQLPTTIEVLVDNVPQAGVAFNRILQLPPNLLPPTATKTYDIEVVLYYGTIIKKSKFKIKVGGIPSLSLNSFDAEIKQSTLTADTKISASSNARGYAGIKFGKAANGLKNTCIKKPLIIVEGIDFGTLENPVGCFNGKCGLLGFDDLINGNNPNYPQLVNGPHFISEINNKGYDVIYLDFEDGANYMEDNAMVLVKLIQHINSIKCSNEELVICGVSMGGIVAKFALSYMEQNNLPHCTRSYVSFDAPHQGANIPIAIQQTLYFAAYSQQNQKAKQGINQLLRPAARQLLQHHVFQSNYGIHPDRIAFLKKQKQLGNFPKNTRNIAVINGNPFGLHSGINLSEKILDYQFDLLFTKVKVEGFAQTGRDYYGKMITFKYDGIGSKQIYNAPFFPQDIDRAPGGTDYKTLGLLSSPQFRSIPIMGTLSHIRVGFMNTIDHPMCFIPSISALDVKTTDLYYDIFSNISPDKPDPSKYPFEAYYAPTTTQVNEPHVYLSYEPSTHPQATKKSNIQWFIHEVEKSKIEITTDLSSTYNFVYSYQNKLPGITVRPAGHVLINANSSGGFNTYPSPIPGSHLTVYKSGCLETVTIENQGKVTIGDPNGNTGDLIFKKGSTLILMPGSLLTIHDGSRLVIEEGAKIAYHQGARIMLEGSNAKLEIAGRLELMNAEFTFSHTSTMGGFVHFDVSSTNSGIYAYGSNSSLKLVGNSFIGIPDKVLEISGGLLKTRNGASALTKFEITNGDVLIHENSGFNPTIPTYLTNSTFEGASTSNSVGIITDQFQLLRFNRCWFKNLGIGISTDLIPNPTPSVMSYVNFRNNGIGLQTNHGSLKLEHCDFINNQTGWRANDLTSPGQATDCRFENNLVGLEIESPVNAHFFAETCDFTHNETGLLSMLPLNLTVQCSRFQYNNYVGIQTHGILSLSGSILLNGKTGGNSVFYNNSNGISIIGALYLEGGNNVFMNDGQYASNDFITGQLNPCFPCAYMNTNWEVYANNNYWQPAVQTSMYVIAAGMIYNSGITGVNNPVFSSPCFVLNDMGKPEFLNEGIAEMGKKELTSAVKEQPNSLTLYPNPAQNYVMLDGLAPETNYTIHILDALGKSVKTANSIGTSQKRIQLESLLPGMYIVSVSTQTETTYHKIQITE